MTARQIAYWCVFAAALTIYLVMVTWTLPGIASAAGGLPAFDLRPGGYSPDEARAFLGALSDEGRTLYRGPQKILDLFYPALLAIVLAGGAIRLFRPGPLRWIFLVLILVGMGADYTENALIGALLDPASPQTDQAIRMASRVTVVKSATTGLAMVGLLGALVGAFIRRRRRA